MSQTQVNIAIPLPVAGTLLHYLTQAPGVVEHLALRLVVRHVMSANRRPDRPALIQEPASKRAVVRLYPEELAGALVGLDQRSLVERMREDVWSLLVTGAVDASQLFSQITYRDRADRGLVLAWAAAHPWRAPPPQLAVSEASASRTSIFAGVETAVVERAKPLLGPDDVVITGAEA